MPRPGRFAASTLSFGPGPITPAVKWIVWANVAAYVASVFFPVIVEYLGLMPESVIERGWLWQPVTYMFFHAGISHILFNMLGIWMFGVELERMWGTKFFLRYYAITGVGAAVTTIVVGLLPFAVTAPTYFALTIGASGAFYGLLLAYGMYFPDRPAASGGPRVAHAAHLGGLIFGYLYLHNGRGGLTAEIKYRYLKWKMNRLRRKFDVYSGGRSDWDRKVH